MPRSNSSNADAPTRPRRSATTRPGNTSARSTTVDAAADRSTSSAGGDGGNTTEYSPSYDEIAEAAYQRYLKRGGGDGQDFDDWLEAERELKTRRRTN